MLAGALAGLLGQFCMWVLFLIDHPWQRILKGSAGLNLGQTLLAAPLFTVLGFFVAHSWLAIPLGILLGYGSMGISGAGGRLDDLLRAR